MKQGTKVYLRGRKELPGIVCAVQRNLFERSEPTRYWVLWKDSKKTDHEEDQLETRCKKGKYEN